MVAYFWRVERTLSVVEGVSPRKLVVLYAEDGRDCFSTSEGLVGYSGGSSSSTGLGSTSCIGTAEMEERVSLVVSAGKSFEADIPS